MVTMKTERRATWEVKVESYAGYKGEEHPRRFQLGDQMLEVTEILDRWYEPDANYFKLRAGDGNHYILKNHGDRWTLESFINPKRRTTSGR